MYADRELTCRQCGGVFVFSAGQQRFHRELGFPVRPKRCSPCRQSRKVYKLKAGYKTEPWRRTRLPIAA